MENEKIQENKNPSSNTKKWSLQPTWQQENETPTKSTGIADIIISAVLFTVIIIIVGSLLSLVYYNTKDRIRANEVNATQDALETIFPMADEFDDVYDELDSNNTVNGVSAIYKVYDNEQLIGYCTAIKSAGFSGQGIEMIVGSDDQNRVVMIKILESGETPGKGTDLLYDGADFLAQFIGLSRPVEFSTTISAVSGATATSEGVRTGVDNALKAVDLVRVTLDHSVGDNHE